MHAKCDKGRSGTQINIYTLKPPLFIYVYTFMYSILSLRKENLHTITNTGNERDMHTTNTHR